VSAPTAYYILVISDDSGTDRQLRRAFKKTAPACNVRVVRSRKELDALHPPSLIILDLMRSSEAPFDVLRWLRTEPHGLERIVRAIATYVGLISTPGCASFA